MARRRTLASLPPPHPATAVARPGRAGELLADFFQLPAFYYLTGFSETDAVLLMVKRNGAVTATPFVPTRTPMRERWQGARTRVAELEAKVGIPGREIGQLHPIVDSLATSGLPFYVVPDVQTSDYMAQDSLTRGARFLSRSGSPTPGWSCTRSTPRSTAFGRGRVPR